MDEAGYQDVEIFLTSGFGNPDKVKAFTRAEKILGIKLFLGLALEAFTHLVGAPQWIS